MVNAAHVLQREQVAAVVYHVAVGILKAELQTAELCALAAVGTSRETVLRGIALSAVTDAQGTMNKHLKFNVGHRLVDGLYISQRQLASQHYATEAQRPQPAHFLHRAVVRLGACMQRQRGVLQERHVLHQHGIDTDALQVVEQLSGVVKFVVVDDGVHRDIHLSSILVSILAQLLYVLDRIARSSPCAEAFRPDVNGISAM